MLEHCTGLAVALGALAGAPVSGVAVAMQVRMPEVMAAAYGASNLMAPSPPVPVAGGGWLHADLGAPGDETMFDTLLSTLPSSAGAAEVAAAAQEWRLAVCDYRPRTESAGQTWSFTNGAGSGSARDEVRVLDLTNMWAGPLATWLLASLGWSVTKVEPSFRPDGFRALDGGGIHPGEVQCDPGRDSAMWNALNHGKDVVDLDLRVAADRNHFVELAAASDVVIDSFSPRVMPNVGLRLPAGPVYVSMPAFPAGPQRDWVAFGTGIHAVSGLGEVEEGRFAPPAVAYPDPVAGFTAALATAAAVHARRRGLPVARVECSLLGAVQPLLASGAHGAVAASAAGAAPPAGAPARWRVEGPSLELGARILAAGESLGLLEARDVCGRRLLHPRGIFPAK